MTLMFFSFVWCSKENTPRLDRNWYGYINPVQTVVKDMNPEELIMEFGDEIAFWRGIDV